MELVDLMGLVTEYADTRKELCTELRAFFKDVTISLDCRWKLFEHSTRLNVYVRSDWCIPDFKTIPHDMIHRMFWEQRYKTIDIKCLLEVLDLSEEDELKLKEEILQKGITEFVYDW